MDAVVVWTLVSVVGLIMAACAVAMFWQED
jgi:hypothetical protein